MSDSNKPTPGDLDDDFWDLGDDLPSTPSAPEPKVSVREEAREAAPAPLIEPAPSVEPAAPIESQAEELPHQASSDEESVEAQDEPKRKSTIVEKLGIAAVIALLLGGAAWGLHFFLQNAPQGDLITFDEDFPIKGENLTIEEVKTWWRSPVRKGDAVDAGVAGDINLIPCVQLKISGAKDTSLLVTFQDGSKNLVGDPTTLAVKDGKFVRSGADTIVLNSTSGFRHSTDINLYVSGVMDPWSIVVEEGQTTQTDEDPLAKVKIRALYQTSDEDQDS